MRVFDYDRYSAVEYAKRWAYSRNPKYYDFTKLGGDCTNFASQCLYAGSGIMNFTPDLGWYYQSVNNRSAAWTGVEYFYNFLIGNLGNAERNNRGGIGSVVGNGSGPFAIETSIEKLEIGDFIQLGNETGDYYHTPIVVGFTAHGILLSAHSYDAYDRPLSSYAFDKIRCLHILGVRSE